eukprot:scaffold82347_cov46-Attheya_sp.AAC.3
MEAAPYPSLTMTGNRLTFFEAHDFISPLVMEYLGVRSLVRFSATTKRHLKCKDMEVARLAARSKSPSANKNSSHYIGSTVSFPCRYHQGSHHSQ